MCGNFGLLLLQKGEKKKNGKHDNAFSMSRELVLDELDRSLNRSRSINGKANADGSLHRARQISIESMRKVSELNRIRLNDSVHNSDNHSSESVFFDYDAPNQQSKEIPVKPVLPLLQIIETQTSSTEVRGGQAGGISCIEYTQQDADILFADTTGREGSTFQPLNTRVRCLGRRREALAPMLIKLFKKACKREPSTSSTVTIVGHTRFATGSFNAVPELHPHEWVPFHEERVWNFRTGTVKTAKVGLHISHNGDFDALELYGRTMVNGEVGLWLERVLHTPNDTAGDSPKIAGCLDLFFVQGRWQAAARLAYLRCILSSPTDVSDKGQLSKSASNTVPGSDVWGKFESLFMDIWTLHVSNVVKPICGASDLTIGGQYYTIDAMGEAQLRVHLLQSLSDWEVGPNIGSISTKSWTTGERNAFIFHTVRGFLRYDLYTAMTEFLSRAEGSFGLQVHSTLEPGVVVIASKGQPMSVAFDPAIPLCLFGSEAQAVAAPVDESGRWLPHRIDLDSRGEIMRIGAPRLLIEGSFDEGLKTRDVRLGSMLNRTLGMASAAIFWTSADHSLLLDCGVELRAYSLQTNCESRRVELMDRTLEVLTAPVLYDPRQDLVASDLAITPASLARIDEAWNNPRTHERIAAEELCSRLVSSMSARQLVNKDSIDLLIGGVEASLWIAEQWAADLRSLFPFLNVVTQSTNKLMGLEGDSPGKIFFSGCESTSWRRIDSSTCVLLISQSGQTFPTLHATREISHLVGDRLWILTGCFHSKMEQVLRESYRDRKREYCNDRVFNNYSGNCPAEPTSVAAAATHHTLSRLMLHLIEETAALQRSASFDRSGNSSPNSVEDPSAHSSDNIPLRRVSLCSEPKPTETNVELLHLDMDFPHMAKETDKGVHAGTPSYPGCWFKASADEIRVPAPNKPLMTLAPSCVDDVRSLLTLAVIPGLERIVGVDRDMRILTPGVKSLAKNTESGIHERLVKQGRKWARHVQEPWEILVLVGAYLIVSVGLGLPIFAILAHVLQEIIVAASGGVYGSRGKLSFSPLNMEIIQSQPAEYTIIGVFIQFVDAVFYVYLAKMFTWGQRWFEGRPMWARHGRRSLVIVDSPMVHQLTENFVSKLYAQAYSFCGLDVHGANGLDHFVHRFTHRVCRGVLLAVGRPDGRLCCLAKSETAILLATKQAAFIQNPDYIGDGSAPDIVSIGHNSFSPNLGLVNHIVIPGTRGAFLDEIVFEQLSGHPQAGEAVLELLRRLFYRICNRQSKVAGKLYGSKVIENFVTEAILGRTKDNATAVAWGKLHEGDIKRPSESYDPSGTFAFISRLDSNVQMLLQLQRPLQQLYEGRVAALERYVSFCVMFHAMAKQCSSPWFRPPWDIARSQSNLRIATTASPVAVSSSAEDKWPREIHHAARQLAGKLRGFVVHM